MGRAEALEEHLMKKRCVFHCDGKEGRRGYREECPGFCDQQELDQYMWAFDEMENSAQVKAHTERLHLLYVLIVYKKMIDTVKHYKASLHP